MHVKREWSKLLQPILLPLAFILGIGSFILVADGKTKKSRPSAPDAPPPAPKPDYKYMQGDKKKRRRHKK